MTRDAGEACVFESRQHALYSLAGEKALPFAANSAVFIHVLVSALPACSVRHTDADRGCAPLCSPSLARSHACELLYVIYILYIYYQFGR